VRRGRVIALDRLSGRPAAALLVDGRLDDLLVDPPPGDPAPAPEAVFRAKIVRAAPALGACFVDLGGGAAGWLRGEGAPGASPLVQIARFADPGKAAPVTERLTLKGRTALVTPGAPGANVSRSVKGRAARERLAAVAEAAAARAPEGVGLVLRTAAAEAGDAEILEEIDALLADLAALEAAPAQAPALLRAAPGAQAQALRDWEADAVDDAPEAFERLGVHDAVAELASPRAPLPGGGWISVEATAAMVAVDVNTGDDFSKGAAQRVNLAACAELPRQLRLRGLGGVVLLDPAPIKKGARQGMDAALKRAFAADPVETQIAGWTPLGNVEMLRRRERRPLRELLDG